MERRNPEVAETSISADIGNPCDRERLRAADGGRSGEIRGRVARRRCEAGVENAAGGEARGQKVERPDIAGSTSDHQFAVRLPGEPVGLVEGAREG